jgi:(S)-ureidoglycine aminohydrolase
MAASSPIAAVNWCGLNRIRQNTPHDLMTMMNRLGHSRTIVTKSYALISADSHVASALPGWSNCRAIVQISATLGAHFSQILITLDANGRGKGEGDTLAESWFFYVVSGSVTLNGEALTDGGFGYVPPGQHYLIAGAATLLVVRKQYEPLSGQTAADAPAFFTGQEQDLPAEAFLGDRHARLKVLIPDMPEADMAMNIFTYDPGATLPFVESHVMEHGMLFLAGGGIYRLDNDWYPVTAGDAIWIAPYCPQWFIAAGPEPARYIYYKDVNRLPA